MYKAQFKSNNAYETWSTIGNYSSESEAISCALRKKLGGAFMVRVVDRTGNTLFTA